MQVLTDPKISREVLQRRAKGLKKLGAIFQVGTGGGSTLLQSQLSGVNEANGFPHFSGIRYTSAYHSAPFQTSSGCVDVNGDESCGRNCLFRISMPASNNDINLIDHHYRNNHNQVQFSYNHFT